MKKYKFLIESINHCSIIVIKDNFKQRKVQISEDED